MLHLEIGDQERHGDDAQQHGHGVDEAGIAGVLAEHLAELSHDVGGRSDGGEQADEQQCLAVGHQSGGPAEFAHRDQDQRQDHEPQQHRLPDPAIGPQAAEVDVGHQHTHDQHGDGAHRIARHGESALHDVGQGDLEKEQQQAQGDGENIDVAHHLPEGDVPLAADEDTAVGPAQGCHQHTEDGHVHDPLLPEHRADQGNGQVCGVGIHDGGGLHGIQPQKGGEQPTQQKVQRVQDHGAAEGKEHHPGGFRRPLELKGADNDAGGDDIQEDHGQDPAVLRAQNAGFDDDPAQQDQDEEGCDLPKEQQAQHDSSTSFRRSR